MPPIGIRVVLSAWVSIMSVPTVSITDVARMMASRSHPRRTQSPSRPVAGAGPSG